MVAGKVRGRFPPRLASPFAPLRRQCKLERPVADEHLSAKGVTHGKLTVPISRTDFPS